MARVRHALFLIVEKILRIVVVPSWRAKILRLMGAEVGLNVRVYECRFMNLGQGFSNLTIKDDVHIGPDCLIDLKGHVVIGKGTTLSPRVTLISHSDPGSAHGSRLTESFPPEALGLAIGEGCWIGANSTVLSGTEIGSDCVVGAMSLVRGSLPSAGLYVGIPVRRIRSLK